MSLQLSDEELRIIENWYHSAAGESASGLSIPPIEHLKEEYRHEYPARIDETSKVRALLDKLGFEMDDRDTDSLKRAGLL